MKQLAIYAFLYPLVFGAAFTAASLPMPDVPRTHRTRRVAAIFFLCLGVLAVLVGDEWWVADFGLGYALGGFVAEKKIWPSAVRRITGIVPLYGMAFIATIMLLALTGVL
jgi:hypothetical protein